MLVRVETSRVGPARLPSAASWRVSSSFAYRIHWRLGRSDEKSAQVVEAARKTPWGGRVTGGTSRFQAARRQAARYYAEARLTSRHFASEGQQSGGPSGCAR